MPKINQEEYEILKHFKEYEDGHWNWIARNGGIFRDKEAAKVTVYHHKVEKGESSWEGHYQDRRPIGKSVGLFQFIKWSDEKPHNIQELIEEYEGYKGSWQHAIDLRKESEEKEVKDIEWLELKLNTEIYRLQKSVVERKETTDESAYNDGRYRAVESVLRLIDQLDEPETLSQEWVRKNEEQHHPDSPSNTWWVEANKLDGLLVPKLGETEITGEQKKKLVRGEELEEIAGNIREQTGYFVEEIDTWSKEGFVKIIQLPEIPQFVANWIPETKKHYTLMALLYDARRWKLGKPRIETWISENEGMFARAWLDGFTILKEQEYYAKVKGHELMSHGVKYWNYKTDDEALRVSTVSDMDFFKIKMSIREWNDLGIDSDNADFVKVWEDE